ncbi:MAG: hypothetical protein M0007_08450 [Actinomycetota bacterium]|nr:hypothetical protein [Actinomycetota bacterium]
MESLWPRIEPLLARVTKPARYIGGELGAQHPDHHPDRVAWLLVYPDTYEIGLPNQGLQILYEILNERSDAVAERAYAPWLDMEAAMRHAGVPLFSIERCGAAAEFDVLAFNLSAELVYTNVLNLIDLAGLPVRAAQRDARHPLVIVGGHGAFNPEPLADFVDAAVLGDGEEAVGEITAVVAAWRQGTTPPGVTAPEGVDPRSRQALLRTLATVPGVYVPWCYEPEYVAGPPWAGWRPPAPASPRLRPRWRSGPSPTWVPGRTRSGSWSR